VESDGVRPTRVLIADGDARERATLAGLLEEAGFEVLQASRGDEAVAVARERRPAVAILEIPLEVLSGYEVCRALKEQLGAAFPVVFLSGHRTESYDRVAGLLLGASDYVVKPYAPDELLARIRLLEPRADELWERGTPLTPREVEVLGLLAEGLRQDEISTRLGIKSRTVGTHIENILRKLGVHSRTQAVAFALRRGGSSPLPDERATIGSGARS
jgi:DNA-binding NarL/FixJ family response regulator